MITAELWFVVGAGVLTAVICGLGTLPFFFVDEISPRVTVVLWGFAGGVMLFASLFGFIVEGLEAGSIWEVSVGLFFGVAIVVGANWALTGYRFPVREMNEADFRKLALIVGVLTVHSFPEGIALGVSFAEIGLTGDLVIGGMAIPALAVFVTLAVAIQNIPEGLAVAIPLFTYGVSRWRIFAWAVITSLPQPIGAAIAYVFVSIAYGFLPYGFGFAAGAMIYLVLHDIFPEAIDRGTGLAGRGYLELVVGITTGVILMVPLFLLFG